MTVDEKNMHNQISFMQIHAQNMQKSVLEKSGYAKLSTEVHARSGLEQPRQGLDNHRTAAKKSWNNLSGIFLTVLKLFHSWNIIQCLSTNGGIMVFQLFQAASVKGGIFYSSYWNNIPVSIERMEALSQSRKDYDRKRLIPTPVTLGKLVATKSNVLMLMIASLASGIMAVLLALTAAPSLIFISIPGFVVGAFFAIKYATFDKSRARQEEHKRSRNRHKH